MAPASGSLAWAVTPVVAPAFRFSTTWLALPSLSVTVPTPCSLALATVTVNDALDVLPSAELARTTTRWLVAVS